MPGSSDQPKHIPSRRTTWCAELEFDAGTPEHGCKVRPVFGVIIPVGPGERDVGRLRQLLEELAEHESRQDLLLVVADDDPFPREIELDWPHAQIFRTEARRRRKVPDAYSGMVATTLEGLRICRDSGVDMALKLDTDAAVIGPFSEKIRAAFRGTATLGVVGSYDLTSGGGHRDWSVWRPRLRRAAFPIRLVRSPNGRLTVLYKTRRECDAVRRLISTAGQHAPDGAHCLGGAYAVSRAFLEHAELDYWRWLGTGLGEDVVVGILCSACGLNMRSLVARDQPFALSWRGLPASPAELARSGHSLVHSVKAATLDDERQLRAALRSFDA